MTDDPRWIEFARSKIGVWTDGPDVPRIAREVGGLFPKFATYALEAKDDTPWCGIFVFGLGSLRASVPSS
jgi:hypothetical protein